MKTTKVYRGGRVGLGWSEMFKPGSKQDLDKRSVPRKVAANPEATRFLPVRFLKSKQSRMARSGRGEGMEPHAGLCGYRNGSMWSQ